MKKYLLLVLKFVFILTLVGCSSESKIIDDIDLVTAVGYDYIDDSHVRGTISIPVFKPDNSVTSETFSEVSTLIRENRAKLDSESNKPLLSGKLDLALYSEELAEHGIFESIDYLNRDPSVGSRVLIAVVKGQAKDYITKKFQNQDTGVYIAGILEKNIKNGTIPKTNLHQLMYTYYSSGRDPFLPLLTMKNDKVKIDGIALFNEDKYVGKIPFKKDFAFKTLVENFNYGIFTIHNGKKSADIENVKAKRDYKVNSSTSIPKVKIEIKIEGVLRDYKGSKINQKVVLGFQKKMEKQLNKDYKSIISTLQELNIDPLGIGDIVKSKDRSFNLQRYKDYYPEMQIETKVKVKIIEFGVTQ